MSKKMVMILSICSLLFLASCGDNEDSDNPTEKDNLNSTEAFNNKRIAIGEKLFFEANLSTPRGQSCASCHDPKSGFADPSKEASSSGADTTLKGDRNAPTTTYVAHIPEFHFDEKIGDYIGGQFLDGRAKTLAEQAKGPLLNRVEMGNKSKRDVVDKVENLSYVKDIYAIYGEDTFKDDTETAYDIIANLLASYQKSKEMSPFNSKYDYYLDGKIELTQKEQSGLGIFNGKGQCFICHNSKKPSAEGHSRNTDKPLFSTYRYYNLGLAKNEDNNDLGLGGTLKDPMQNGKFKVPTLRNIALTAPYMHDGSLKTLKEVIDFYNTRDTDAKWGNPAFPETIDHEGIGNLGLSEKEIDDIIIFLKTLTDGYKL